LRRSARTAHQVQPHAAPPFKMPPSIMGLNNRMHAIHSRRTLPRRGVCPGPTAPTGNAPPQRHGSKRSRPERGSHTSEPTNSWLTRRRSKRPCLPRIRPSRRPCDSQYGRLDAPVTANSSLSAASSRRSARPPSALPADCSPGEATAHRTQSEPATPYVRLENCPPRSCEIESFTSATTYSIGPSRNSALTL